MNEIKIDLKNSHISWELPLKTIVNFKVRDVNSMPNCFAGEVITYHKL